MMQKHVRLLKPRKKSDQLIKDVNFKLFLDTCKSGLQRHGVCTIVMIIITNIGDVSLLFRYEDDANDDPDYQQPASMSQKDDDMDDEDDKVHVYCSYFIWIV